MSGEDSNPNQAGDTARDGVVREAPVEGHPHVLRVTIDRPPVNAMSPDMYRQLADIFEGLDRRSDVRCVILTGAGDKSFIAGADVKQLSQRTPASVAERSRISRRAYEAIRLANVPIIAAVNGVALGSGFIIASVCDVILASDRARFGIPEITVGALGGSKHAARVLPEKIMRYLILSGDRVDGLFLQRHGVVLDVLPPEELQAKAVEIAARFAKVGPTLMRLRKESMSLTGGLPFAEGYRVEQLYTQLVSDSADAINAVNAVAAQPNPDKPDRMQQPNAGETS